MVKVGERWLPEELATDFEKAIDELAAAMGGDALLNQGMNAQQKTAVLGFIKVVDGVLGAVEKAQNEEQLMGAVVGASVGLQIAAQNLQNAFDVGGFAGGGPGLPGTPNPGTGTGLPGLPNPGTGINPGTGVGTNNPPALPGLTPQPAVPVGRTETWRINSGSKSRIDLIYKGKSVDTIKKAFGEPDAMEGPYWVYNGMRVRNIASGGTLNTVLFRIQGGMVVEVRAR